MRTLFGLVFCFLCAGAAQAQESPALTGQLAALQYLVGSWDCTVSTAAGPMGPAKTENSQLSFGVGGGNTLTMGVSTEKYSSAGFSGFANGSMFQVGSDSEGSVWNYHAAMPRSGGPIVFAGTLTMGGQALSARETDTTISDTEISSISEINAGGKWMKVAESHCKKT